MDNPELPVRRLAGQLHAHLATANRLIIAAPTGSGKTTQVPQMLLAKDVAAGQIAVLQPRRLAARLIAGHVAREVGCPVGDLVGYQTRHERCLSHATRIRFLTDGLFLRLCQSDGELRDFGAVVIDEFHERRLAADLTLGWIRQLQETRRPDLVLIIMSATLEVERLAAELRCPVLQTRGRTYPVEVRYAPSAARTPIWEHAARALHDLVEQEPEGDVLVFMPGRYEIHRTIEAAAQRLAGMPAAPLLLPLYGALPAAEQDRAVAPTARRKIIVSTNVAETSLTIPGVRHVLDSGLARIHRHDPRRGIDVLLVEPVSRAAAEQRAGRAGRTSPGSCVRLWSAASQDRRPERDVPEVLRVDLAEAVLRLAAMGVSGPRNFPWLDDPPAESLQRARQLLVDLGALAADGGITATGVRLAELPMHPRLGRMLLEARDRGLRDRAALWAALLSERDILKRGALTQHAVIPVTPFPSDLSVREKLFRQAREAGFAPAVCGRLGVRAETCRQVEQTRRLYARASDSSGHQSRTAYAGDGREVDLIRCVLTGFFDRVAVRRGDETLRYAMAGQRRVELDARSVARESRALVALDVRELSARRHGVRTVLSLASAIDPAWLEELHPERIQARSTVTWNAAEAAVEQHDEWVYDGLVYHRAFSAVADPAAAADILVDRIRAQDVRLDRWNTQVEQWIYRTRLVARLFPERQLTDYDEEDVAVILHEIVAGATRASHLPSRPCLKYVRQALSYADQQFVEQMAPARIPLPGGTHMRLEYQADGPPRGRARIQELYGLRSTPVIAQGRQPVLLEILGPNMRPVQVTDDLASFWRHAYPELKRELQRRYPKHEWR